ncbi:MAG: type II secretion system F family protein [Eubacterium sp.]
MSGLQINMMFITIPMPIMTIVLALSIMIFAFFLGFAVISKVTEDQRYADVRITKIIGKRMETEPVVADTAGRAKRARKAKRKANNSNNSIFEKVSDRLFDELVAADIMMRPEEFLTIWVVLAFVPASLVGLFSKNVTIAAILLVAGCAGPALFIKQKQDKRRKSFEGQLSDALTICCSCLRSGLSFQQAMETIGDEMDAPISVEFKRACSEVNYGHSLDVALENMVARVKSSDLMLAVSAVNVQRQTGGNLSEILETIANTIRDRFKIKKEIKAITAQGITSGTVIGALPVFLALILYAINRDYIMMLFTETAGHYMIGYCVISEIIGFLAIRKTVTIKY